MNDRDRQREHLNKVIHWAQKIEDELHEIIWHHHFPVHFRPGSKGVAIVGLTPRRPQRGRSGFTNLDNIYNNFNELLSKHCIDIPQGRKTPEKALQSFLIMKSKSNCFQRWIGLLNDASDITDSPARLRWVTDEIAVPVGKKRIVCDLLAMRETDSGGRVPVVIELKSARLMKKLVQQVTDYAALVDAHPDLYAQLFSVILKEEIAFTGPCEKWIVWPLAGEEKDPREKELAEEGIRVVGYKRTGWGFKFRVGEAPTPNMKDRFLGCLLGGAVGDALGAPVEFLSLREIREAFGRDGVTGMEPAYGRRGAITDDTQMTLFTAEGLIRAMRRYSERGICHPPSVVHRAYLRWLHTQGVPWSEIEPDGSGVPDGWLITNRVLFNQRAPGNSCVTALDSGVMGTPDEPINDSKGCGGVMRVAPVGLIAVNPFDLGSECAAITHGHLTGYLAAGALAVVVSEISKGQGIDKACQLALEELAAHDGHEETTRVVEAALALAGTTAPSPEAVETLGRGWIAEEALAISLYCALTAPDFRSGVLTAVNHGGDSDSTGAITGNLLGCLRGVEEIPPEWIEQLEAREVIERVARDLCRCVGDDDLEEMEG